MTQPSPLQLRVALQTVRPGFTLAATFAAPTDSVTAIFGPSGAGKSTLLRAIAGLDTAAVGTVTFGAEHWLDTAAQICVPPHRRRIGYVVQGGGLFEHLSVRGNLLYGFSRTPAPSRRLSFDEAVTWAGLRALLERPIAKLSGGEKNRVALARALLTSPRLLLLDEPLAALDATARAELLSYLERAPRELGVPLLYVSHAIDEVARLADRMLLLDGGRLVADGETRDLLTRLDLPLSHSDRAAAIIDATVGEVEREHALAWAEFPGGRLCLVTPTIALGTRVRLQVQARDVSLSLAPLLGSSILNAVCARIVELRDDGPGQVLVKLDAEGTVLLSRVTRKSRVQLGLEVGMSIYAQVKGVALVR